MRDWPPVLKRSADYGRRPRLCPDRRPREAAPTPRNGDDGSPLFLKALEVRSRVAFRGRKPPMREPRHRRCRAEEIQPLFTGRPQGHAQDLVEFNQSFPIY